MKCKNCGNELEKADKYCGKCGSKIIIEKNTNNVIKIKFNYLICAVFIALALVLGIVIVIFNLNQKKTDFDVDITELSNAIIKSQKVIDKDSKFSSDLSYKVENIKDEAAGENAIVYTLEYKDFNSMVIPPIMLVANANTKKVYKIYIAMPYSSGTTLNTSALERNLTMLATALNVVNKKDLKNDIFKIIDKMQKSSNGLKKDFNINGVYIYETEKTVSTKYSSGKYLIFSAIKNN